MLFRVLFEGPALSITATEALTAAGLTWEHTECDAEGPCRHSVLAEADTESVANAAVGEVLGAYSTYGQYAASPVRDFRGEIWDKAFYRSWREIDWDAVPRRAKLTLDERAVMLGLLNSPEPTWILAEEIGVTGDRARAESALRDLEEQQLVRSVLDQGGEPGRESDLDRWWGLTAEGWEVLGLVNPRVR